LTAADPIGYGGGMITLARGPDTVQLTLRLWESLQIVAKQSGWQPAGGIGTRYRAKHSVYAPGCTVAANDARHLAESLERFVNGEAADAGDLDLAALARRINFLRGGAVEIR
jgi:hypothetical protein